MTQLLLAVTATSMSLLALSSWRFRTTAIGRSFLAFVVLGDLLVIVQMAPVERLLGGPLVPRVAAGLALLSSAAVLRLVSQAVSSSSTLEPREQAIIWGLTALALFTGDARAGALCSGVLLVLASVRITRMPQHSWVGSRTTLRWTSLAMWVPGLVSVSWLAGAPGELIATASPLSTLGLTVVLYLALPRLGLLLVGRVRLDSVIEAMSDGVLVADMDGRLVDFNRAAREILELEEGGSRLPHLSDALVHHPDLVELFAGAIDGSSVYTPDPARRGGESKTYHLQLSALRDSTGSLQSRVLVLRDFTEHMEMEAENRRHAKHARLVHQASALVHEADSIEQGLEATLELISNTMGYSVGHFLRSTDTPEGSRLIATGIMYFGRGSEHGLDSVAAQTSSEVAGFWSEDGAVLSEGIRKLDPRGAHWWRPLGFELALTLPVLIGSRLYGVLEFFSSDDSGIEAEDSTSGILEHLGELVGRAVERKLADEKIRRLAYRDDLTGLPNRQRFHQLLHGAVSLAERAGQKMALIFMDLDGFKKVNDTLGHDVGDRLLAEVATRFAGVVRVSDHIGHQNQGAPEVAVSRLGGDEFTVLLTQIQDPSDAALVADRLLTTLEAPILLDGNELFMSTSIGIAVFPEDGADAETLLRNSDAAMYFAKGRGRNGYQFYSKEMNRTRSDRIEFEARLRGAVEREDFQVFYQPLVDTESGCIIGAEALVRWIDEEQGFVPPDEFIPVAEETGLIVSLGRWVFRTACEQARQWRDELGISIRIGVNVSGQQIREPGMVEMVRTALGETGVEPEQVELEITESTIMQDDALTARTLHELKAMGVGLALDDLGTGYSSLSYLRRFTIDRVKIDRSFVSELPDNDDDAALTTAIIAMAHGLRLKVVAEGVETPRQGFFLRQRGCDELQGYLFGRPCPPEEFVDLLLAKPRTIDELEKSGD